MEKCSLEVKKAENIIHYNLLTSLCSTNKRSSKCEKIIMEMNGKKAEKILINVILGFIFKRIRNISITKGRSVMENYHEFMN